MAEQTKQTLVPKKPAEGPPPGTKVRVKALSFLHGRLYHAGDIVTWQKGWGPLPKGAVIVETPKKG